MKEQAESFDYLQNAHDSDRLNVQYPYSYESIYKLQQKSSYQPPTQKHITKNQKQFEEILAKAKYLPPLESREQKPRYNPDVLINQDPDSPIINHIMTENKAHYGVT